MTWSSRLQSTSRQLCDKMHYSCTITEICKYTTRDFEAYLLHLKTEHSITLKQGLDFCCQEIFSQKVQAALHFLEMHILTIESECPDLDNLFFSWWLQKNQLEERNLHGGTEDYSEQIDFSSDDSSSSDQDCLTTCLDIIFEE